MHPFTQGYLEVLEKQAGLFNWFKKKKHAHDVLKDVKREVNERMRKEWEEQQQNPLTYTDLVFHVGDGPTDYEFDPTLSVLDNLKMIKLHQHEQV